MPPRPTASWTLQQLREVIGSQHQYKYILHDRDSIFANHLDESIERLGIKVLKSPPRSPKANAICERVIGTIRRECLDWLIPVSDSHLRSILESWISRYNAGRPHMVLGPGVPDPPCTPLEHTLPIRAIATENRTRCVPVQSLAGCITNISSRPHVRDRFLTDHRGRKKREDQAISVESSPPHTAGGQLI